MYLNKIFLFAIPITRDDVALRRNYTVADNSDVNDGDQNSTIYFEDDTDRFSNRNKMYNSPKKPTVAFDSITGQESLTYDASKNRTLISDKTRVYKGGSWSDREYWLDPAQRRYLPEYMATNSIGFRCVTDVVGPMTTKNRKARSANP